MPIDAVPDDVDGLRALVNQLSSERDAAIAESRRLTEQNDQLRHLLKQLQRAQFGQRSERLDRDQMQLALEDIETSLASRDAEEEEHQNGAADKPAVQRKKRRINRGALPAHLPHVHVTLEPESTVCPCCHGAMHVIGEENSQRLDKIPARYQVIVTHRPKYGCRACEGAIVQAPAPERLIKSGIPTEGLVASVVVDKFAWHNPLYRQAQIMKLQGSRLHGAQHISEPAKVNAGFSMYHRPRDLDRYRPSTVPNCTCRARLARRGHDRNEHRRLRGRKDQTASPRRFAPPKQMLRCDVVPSRHFRHDYARLIGFRDYSALDLIAPPAPTANPGANINAAASLRSVNYMVNHICEPIQSRRATSSGSDRTLQDGDRAPLTPNTFMKRSTAPAGRLRT